MPTGTSGLGSETTQEAPQTTCCLWWAEPRISSTGHSQEPLVPPLRPVPAELLLRLRPPDSTWRCSEQRLAAAVDPTTTSTSTGTGSRQLTNSPRALPQLVPLKTSTLATLPSAWICVYPWMSRYVLDRCDN